MVKWFLPKKFSMRGAHFRTKLVFSTSLAIERGQLQPGDDVMITMFCDVFQIFAKKLAFFSKTNVMAKYFAKTSST
jgi:hypothetical protein